jgi:transposase
MTGTLTMNAKERKTLSILQQQIGGHLTVIEASEELDISERQFYRIKARFLIEGDAGLVHRARGNGSNRGFCAAVREEVLELHRRKYGDYGPTLFAERLDVNEGFVIDHETLRRWLHVAGLMPTVRKGAKHRKKRPRKPHIGSMVQLDGSDHDWFEGRGPRCTLLVFIDDASSIVFMRFATSENMKEVFAATCEYLERFGIPALFYTDRGSVFHHVTKTVDFIRALKVLGCKVIHAGSAQAKGRVERSNRTHQDRLIKIMREHGISCIKEANAFLEREYLAEHNARFAKPDGLEDVHRPAANFDLPNIFCLEEMRVVRRDMTVQYKAQIMQILAARDICPMPKQYVTIRHWLDDSIHLFWREHEPQWQPAPKDRPKNRATTLGTAQTRDHPWYHKPIGKLKRVPVSKKCQR